MESVQIITNEWIDIIYLDNNTNKAIRKNINFGGSYYFDDNLQEHSLRCYNCPGKNHLHKR